MKKVISLLIFIVLISVPCSASAAIAVVDGEDDCEHEWQEVDYDFDNNIVEYECSLCSEHKTEQLEQFLDDISSPPMMLMMVEADGDYPEEQHDYHVVAFDGTNGVAIVMCYDCGNYFVDRFIDHITTVNPDMSANFDTYVPWLDRNHDNYINGKDYIYLLTDYTDFFDRHNSDILQVLESKHFSYKEIFFYSYFTVLLIFLTSLIFIFIRRSK